MLYVACIALSTGTVPNSIGAFSKDKNADICDFDYTYAIFIWLASFIHCFQNRLLLCSE